MNYYSLKDNLTFISNMKNVELGDKVHFKGDVTLYVKNKDWEIINNYDILYSKVYKITQI